jgi:hypothetical protein
MFTKHRPPGIVVSTLLKLVVYHYSAGHFRNCLFISTPLPVLCFNLHLCWAVWSLSLCHNGPCFYSSGPRGVFLLDMTFLSCLSQLWCQSTNVVSSEWWGGWSPFNTYFRGSELLMLWYLPDSLEHQLFQIYPSPSNVHRVWTPIVPVLFTITILHTTQWLLHINGSLKSILDEWKSPMSTGLGENTVTLSQQPGFLFWTHGCAWLLLPLGWVHTGGSSVSIKHSSLAREPSNLPVMPRYIWNFNYTIRQEAKKSLLSYFPS